MKLGISFPKAFWSWGKIIKKKKVSKGKASILTLLLAMWNGEQGDALHHLRKRIRKGLLPEMLVASTSWPLQAELDKMQL